jgi:hypothetical protein
MKRIVLLIGIVLALSLVLTSQIAAASTGLGLAAANAGFLMFNPQPEPQGQIFAFEVAGTVDGEWVGRFTDSVTGAVGTLVVETVAMTRQGQTLHLVQRWTLIPPDPIFPPDPVHPPDPVVPVTLEGILNLADGILVLNGTVEEGGPAHVRGQAVFGEGGVVSVGGELMFNPQPEPPGQS